MMLDATTADGKGDEGVLRPQAATLICNMLGQAQTERMLPYAEKGRKSVLQGPRGREGGRERKFDPDDPGVAAEIERLLKVDRFLRRQAVERAAERHICRPSTIQRALTQARAKRKLANTGG
jgi:hypothetical protein